MYNDEIYHYGIKGMKWGIRRKRKKITKDDYHQDYKKAHDKESVKTMSDNDLRNKLNRLRMEKEYKKLSRESTRKGSEFVNNVIKTGTTIATLTTTALTIYGNYGKISGIVKKYMENKD